MSGRLPWILHADIDLTLVSLNGHLLELQDIWMRKRFQEFDLSNCSNGELSGNDLAIMLEKSERDTYALLLVVHENLLQGHDRIVFLGSCFVNHTINQSAICNTLYLEQTYPKVPSPSLSINAKSRMLQQPGNRGWPLSSFSRDAIAILYSQSASGADQGKGVVRTCSADCSWIASWYWRAVAQSRHMR